MKVKIYVGLDLYSNQHIVKVDLNTPIGEVSADLDIDLYDLENKGLLDNLINKIEMCVNLCLENHEKDLQQTLDNIVKKYEPKLKEFNDFIKGA